jgi:cation transport ATPase
MNPFEQVEEQIRRREKAIDAREIEARLKEIEKELEAIPVTPTHNRHEEAVSHRPKTRRPLRKISNAAMFTLTVLGVTTAICLSHWIGLTVFIMGAILAAWVGKAVVIMGVIWVAYKIFIENKN